MSAALPLPSPPTTAASASSTSMLPSSSSSSPLSSPSSSSSALVNYPALGVSVRVPAAASALLFQKRPFNLDESLTRLSTLTSFPPTNFYVTWPPDPLHSDSSGAAWIRPSDLAEMEKVRPKTAEDFPARLGVHWPHVLSRTTRLVTEAVEEKTPRVQTAPGMYEGARCKPVVSLRQTITAPSAKPYTHELLVQNPGPGAYTPQSGAVWGAAPAHLFGGVAKNLALSAHPAAGPDTGGPGSYDLPPPPPTTFSFPRGARFGLVAASKTPAPGQYNVDAGMGEAAKESARGGVGSSRGFSFSTRGAAHGGGGGSGSGGGGGGAVLQSARRSRGPDVGTYNPTAFKPRSTFPHKFATTPRFTYHSRLSPLQALILSDARKRMRAMAVAEIAEEKEERDSRERERERERARTADGRAGGSDGGGGGGGGEREEEEKDGRDDTSTLESSSPSPARPATSSAAFASLSLSPMSAEDRNIRGGFLEDLTGGLVLLPDGSRRRSGGPLPPRHFKRTLLDFSRRRREDRVAAARAARESREREVAAAQSRLREEHARKMDAIVNKDRYREEARAARAEAERLQTVQRGWVFYVALCARAKALRDRVRERRTRALLRVLTEKAANTIARMVRRWWARAKAARELRCARVLYRALRRNVVRARLRRKRRHARALAAFLNDCYVRAVRLRVVRRFRGRAVVVQRAWRAFMAVRQSQITVLVKQFRFYEKILSDRYRREEGERAFEKVKKKGLLIKNLSHADQREKMIDTIPFPTIGDAFLQLLIAEDLKERRKMFAAQLEDWRKNEQIRRKKQELAAALQGEIEEKKERTRKMFFEGRREKEKEKENEKEKEKEKEKESELMNLLSSMTDAPPRPFFHVLLSPVRLYAILLNAHSKLTPSVPQSVRAKVKKCMNTLLKAMTRKAPNGEFITSWRNLHGKGTNGPAKDGAENEKEKEKEKDKEKEKPTVSGEKTRRESMNASYSKARLPLSPTNRTIAGARKDSGTAAANRESQASQLGEFSEEYVEIAKMAAAPRMDEKMRTQMQIQLTAPNAAAQSSAMKKDVNSKAKKSL